MDFVPAVAKTLLKIACPSLSATVPMITPPFLNATIPVGVPPYCGTTVAVKATLCPTVDGFGEETSVVVVVAWFTTSPSCDEALPAKVAFPAYTAVMGCASATWKTLLKFARPPLSIAVPMMTGPFMNTTHPVGVPPLPETVAVKDTDWPTAVGFSDETRLVVVAVRLGNAKFQKSTKN